MKILALSMLRLGDLLMHQEIFNDIENAYPGAQLDVVMNETFSSVCDLISGVKQFHFFDRRSMQDNLVLKEGSFFRAYRDLKIWANKIQAEEYDYVLDLTHNHFSRALVSLLQIPEAPKPKRQFIDEIFVDSSTSSFHYIDALKQSLGLSGRVSLPALGRGNPRGAIVIQPLTSDAKKNWSLLSFQALIRKIHSFDPERKITIVGAPSEEATLRSYFPEMPYLHLNICDLKTLKSELQSAALLISGDTATIHLAVAVEIPVLGLYLGSAEPSKTAPRAVGAILIQSHENCVPCKHSSPCSRERQLCADSISPEAIFQISSAVLNQDEVELKKIAWASPFSVLRTESHDNIHFILQDLSRPESSLIAQIRQQTFLKIFNKQEASIEKLCLSFHGEPWELSMLIDERTKNQERIKEVIVDIQDEVRKISRACLRLDIQVESHLRAISPLVREFALFSEDAEWSSCLEAALKQSWEQSSFVVYRRWRSMIDTLSSFYEVELEILNAMKKNLRERGVYYVPGPTRTT